jgi:REP element-mobilizing transposase RayT
MDLITAELERGIHRCVAREAEWLGCAVMAIGGMPDHVHLLLRIPATFSASKLMQQVK